MRKITLFIMILMMVSSLFAYEPKKECVTVKGNKIIYYEKTEQYYSNWLQVPEYEKDYRKWVIRKSYSVEQLAHYYFSILKNNRIPHKYYEFVIAGREASVNYIPFVTEENWLTITEEELLNKIRSFVSDCIK